MRSVAQKLGILPNSGVWTSHRDRLVAVGPLPEGVRIVRSPRQATTALMFVDDAATARSLAARHAEGLRESKTVWVMYPKGNRTGLNRDSLWPILAEHRMRPVGQVAVDAVWSAMRFRPLRDGEAPFTGRATR
jgi:hypothetical protein